MLEASGGYEFLATAALAEAQLPVALINPLAVRKFAGATGKLAKTDKIDAQVLATSPRLSGLSPACCRTRTNRCLRRPCSGACMW